MAAAEVRAIQKRWTIDHKRFCGIVRGVSKKIKPEQCVEAECKTYATTYRKALTEARKR